MLSVLIFSGCQALRPHSNAQIESSEQKGTPLEHHVSSEPDVSMLSTSVNEMVLPTSTHSDLIVTKLHKLGFMGNSQEVCATIEVIVPQPEPPVQVISVPEIEVAPVSNEEHSPPVNNPQSIKPAQFESCIPNEEDLLVDPPIQEKSIEAFPQVEDENKPEIPKTVRLLLELSKDKLDSPSIVAKRDPITFQNGDDVLDLSLPESLTLSQLLDLAGLHLHLDYIYSPQTVGNQSVALKLHGGLNGSMRIKDLYTLLETVLKFNGLAMVRREEKLIAIVPIAEAMDADPRLVSIDDPEIEAGDTVVTRVFELRYVNVASVTNLLQNMKLGVTVSTLQEIQTLLVTCYAHRMGRIEQLIEMLDRPGKQRECRFRRLEYTDAPAVAQKVRVLAKELHVETVGKGSKGAGSAASGQSVYLDTDERTNRLVMIGHEEQLGFLEELVDVLDVTQEDLRTSKIYTIQHIAANEALRKLWEIDIVGVLGNSTGKVSEKSSSAGSGLTEVPAVVVLDTTNQLLVRATQQQHALIEDSLARIDVSLDDLRTLKVYDIQYIDAEQVRAKLEEFNTVGIGSAASPRTRMGIGSAKVGKGKISAQNEIGTARVLSHEPQVVVNESTNSLLINATTEQHERIAEVIGYIDRETPEEEIPYKIYPLENSSPQYVADLLKQLIQEKAIDKEGKIERNSKLPIKSEEQIIIVPDPNTFSLIVYANRKNQEWIENLTKSLDKRRPQVLIDVTLVEITRTDTFEYDLNLVTSAQEAVIGNIGIDPIHTIDRRSRLEGSFNLLDSDGNATGQTKAFYSDDKVQALLTAIKRKNYGRVLAKPKILVDDGQEGQISTTDETTYVKEAVQVPNQGAPITTRDFQPIEASIILEIIPHISEGDLLRLDVHLSREDFGSRPQAGAPPDKATSEITTTVFVPDKNTVILGGLVKLNQSKGGSKIPILGDIPLIGALFRSVDNSDVERKLYVFLKANIVRPSKEARLEDLEKISEEHQKAFEKSEAEFQKHKDFPGVTPKPIRPERVLEEI